MQGVGGSNPLVFTIKALVARVLFSYGGVAQLGERLNGIQEVMGSIPTISTTSEQSPLCSGLFFVYDRK